jgi:Eukaryotic aspartyl protease
VRSQQGHTLYDPSKSTTAAELPGSTFNISYGDGSFSRGPVVTDTVDIGGATVNKQAIGVPNTVSKSFIDDVHSNGLVGLGFSKINTIKPERQKTFFDNVLPELSQPVWTASLKAGVAGAYEFGNIDRSLFQGELTNVTVDSTRGFWEFASTRFAVGDNAPQTASTGSGTAIADTGTSLMLMDDEIVNAYYAQVKGARQSREIGGFVFPCSSSLPDLTVSIGDKYMASVSGQLMNFAQAGTDSASGQTGQ